MEPNTEHRTLSSREAQEPNTAVPEEQEARIRVYARGFDDQDENGIDLGHLRTNLRLTPTERLEKHRRALRFMMEVRRAGERARLSRRSRRA